MLAILYSAYGIGSLLGYLTATFFINEENLSKNDFKNMLLFDFGIIVISCVPMIILYSRAKGSQVNGEQKFC